LGNLELHNFRIEEGGSIEIINRGFVKFYGASSVVGGVVAAPTYNESAPLVAGASSIEALQSLVDISALSISSNLVSSTLGGYSYDSRVSSVGITSYISPIHTTRKNPLTCTKYQPAYSYLNSDVFITSPFEKITTDDLTPVTFDISAISQYDSNRETYRSDIATLDAITGFSVLNSLDRISVKNCDGPIYIRNFSVYGNKTASEGTKVGINIENSNVVLENCGVLNCKDAGFRFNNSKVVLSRSAFSYRNYDISSTTGRIANTGIGFRVY